MAKSKSKIEVFKDIIKKIRHKWIINPRTRIKKSKKKYDRRRAKRDFKRRLREEG